MPENYNQATTHLREHISRQNSCTELSWYHKERFPSSRNVQSTHSLKLISRTNIVSEKMSAPPAVSAHILRNFSIAFIGIVGTIAAGTEVYNIASRKDRELTKGWGERRPYNTQPQPQQDRLDTIFDRTQLLNKAKEAKPWNRTASEYERTKW